MYVVMTDLGRNSGGPKERDNGDRSMHVLMVALTVVGIIAGSVTLFAYASSDVALPASDEEGSIEQVGLSPERQAIVETFVEEPVRAERIHYVNAATDKEKALYVYATDEVEKVEREETAHVSTIEDTGPADSEEQQEMKDKEQGESTSDNAQPNDDLDKTKPGDTEPADEQDEPERGDLVPMRLLQLLDEFVEKDKDKEKDDDDKDDDEKEDKKSIRDRDD